MCRPRRFRFLFLFWLFNIGECLTVVDLKHLHKFVLLLLVIFTVDLTNVCITLTEVDKMHVLPVRMTKTKSYTNHPFQNFSTSEIRGNISKAFWYLIRPISALVKLPFSWIPASPGSACASGTYGSVCVSMHSKISDWPPTVNPGHKLLSANKTFERCQLDNRCRASEIEIIPSKLGHSFSKRHPTRVG
jgi:hypothetical protein